MSRTACGTHRPGLRAGVAAALIVLLSACATPAQLPPGTARAQVIERFGAPQARHPLPGGGERLEYGGGPLAQETWMVDLDAAGGVTAARQVRTGENFARLRLGIDRAEVVQREFGTPWRIERYPLSGLTAWMYPYKEAGVWNSMMAIHFDDAGQLVRVENGPDPRFLGGAGRDD